MRHLWSISICALLASCSGGDEDDDPPDSSADSSSDTGRPDSSGGDAMPDATPDADAMPMCPDIAGPWTIVNAMGCPASFNDAAPQLVAAELEMMRCVVTFTSMPPKMQTAINGEVTLLPTGGFTGANLNLGGEDLMGCTGTPDTGEGTYEISCPFEDGDCVVTIEPDDA